MHKLTLEATLGALLHDIGKMVCRSGQGGSHADRGCDLLPASWQSPGIRDCVRFHHGADADRRLPADHPAWLVSFANRLAAGSGGEGREETGSTDVTQPLRSIFSHLNGEHPHLYLSPMPREGKGDLPLHQETPVTAGEYAAIADKLRAGLSQIQPDESGVCAVLQLLEDCLGFVPGNLAQEESDISLFDHSKITAALASCVSEYLLDRAETDFHGRLAQQEAKFRQEPAFLMYSAGFSGIQRFLFTVATKGALPSLRSRSFFLGLLMEHYVDELLSACSVSRANLLYSGGGNCHLLLPNTAAVKEILTQWNFRFNDWLLAEFGAQLFLAHGWTECCANDLANVPADQSPYAAMSRRVNAAIAAHRLHRYSAGQLRRINAGTVESDGRECNVCGRPDRLNEDGRCTWCSLFVKMSKKILDCPVYLVSREGENPDFVFPGWEGERYFFLTDEKTARARSKGGEAVVRLYSKNQIFPGLVHATRLHVCDYAASREMTELAGNAQGINRLAVCRMDVDNLGHAFVAGFRKPGETDPEKRDRFVNISRTSAFSRQMSRFFQWEINDILEEPAPDGRKLSVAVVYSGGDDVFLVGAWDSVIDAVQRIQQAFDAFCGGALTISAGISMHHDHFPIRLAAAHSKELEDRAKQAPNKNSLALFDPEADHTYCWTEFRQQVLGEKEKTLRDFFHEENQERGNAFLHQLLELLRQMQANQIHLARYAYLLAKMEPREKSRKESYRAFAQSMYGWALCPEDRRQLITAIYLFIYMERKGASS